MSYFVLIEDSKNVPIQKDLIKAEKHDKQNQNYG